jgi:hypothetical protein
MRDSERTLLLELLLVLPTYHSYAKAINAATAGLRRQEQEGNLISELNAPPYALRSNQELTKHHGKSATCTGQRLLTGVNTG